VVTLLGFRWHGCGVGESLSLRDSSQMVTED
jgi:hypothetical protein